MDDRVIWARNVNELLGRLEEELARLVDRRLGAAAHNAVLFKDEISGVGDCIREKQHGQTRIAFSY